MPSLVWTFVLMSRYLEVLMPMLSTCVAKGASAQTAFIQSLCSYKTLDTRLLLKCGRKPTYRLYLEPYFTLMIPLISLTRIENSIPSHLQKAKFVFSKQQKPCFQKVDLIVISPVTCSLNLRSYQVGKLGPIQRYRLLPWSPIILLLESWSILGIADDINRLRTFLRSWRSRNLKYLPCWQRVILGWVSLYLPMSTWWFTANYL